MTLPMIAGIFAMMTFSIADTWFVAQLGTEALAAISFTFPVAMVVSSVAIGLGAGTSSVLARAIGSGRWPRVQRLATDGIVLSAVVGVTIATIGWFTIDPLFRLLGADAATLPLIHDYMSLWYLSAPFLIVPMVGASSIRATGDTRVPSVMMGSSALLNIVLDPLLIFGPGPFPALGMTGAALATLIVKVLLFVVTVAYMHYRLDMLTRHLRSVADLVSSWREVLHVGLPAAGTNGIIPIATGIATAMLASYGHNAVAGYGVASRVESVVLIAFYALSAVIGPFAGQNLGVGQRERILDALAKCAWFSLSVSVLIAIGLAFGGETIALQFDSDPEVVDVAARYFLIVPITYGAAALVMVSNAAFNGLGRPLPAVTISVGRMLVLFLPLGFVLSREFGAGGIFAGLAIANLVCGFGGYVWIRRTVATVAMPRPADAH